MLKWIQVSLYGIIVGAIFFLIYTLLEGRIVATFSIFISISAILIVFTIFIENRDPSITLNWILVFAIFPVLGFFFYLTFGRNYYKKKRYRQKQEKDKEAYNKLDENRQVYIHGVRQLGNHQNLLFRLAHEVSDFPISFNTE